MKKKKSSQAVSDRAIVEFWEWFASYHHEIEAMLHQNDTASLARQMNARVNTLSSQLAWEIGPGLVKPYMLAFPVEGDSERKAFIERLFRAAPRVTGWEFHTSRPVRAFPPEVRLPDRGVSFYTSTWSFKLEEALNSHRFDLHVFDDELASADRDTALTAVFILLDAAMGEDMVEKWIGKIEVLPRSAVQQHDSLPMAAISDTIAGLIPDESN